jgi:spoIIIJ-associated protein
MSAEPISEDLTPGAGARALAETLQAVARGFGVEARITVGNGEEGTVLGAMEGEDVDALVGKGGQTIDAIQYLATQIVSRAEGGARRRVTVDAGGYRARRAAALEELALRAAQEAVEYGEEIELDAMTPHDRRIVHLALQGRTDVVTRSEGEEPRRRIIVEPAEPAD